MTAAVSWSGGKDCCLALHRARAVGLDVRHLLTVLDETGERSRSHGIPAAVMRAQAEALRLPLLTPSASWGDYERVFIDALVYLREKGVREVVFGDIDLLPHREWEEKVCAEARVAARLPLWQEDRRALAEEVLSLGFRALVVCADDRWLPAQVCGRPYDRAFLANLPSTVDACGENGEFHTFVLDGPPFRVPVPVEVTAVESRAIPFGGQDYLYHFARLALGPGSA